MDAKVRVKTTKSASAKTNLLGICSKNGVRISRVVDVHDGYVLFCSSLADIDVLFDSKVQDLLQACSMECVTPPQLRANRTVLIRRVDSVIYDNSVSDIKEEIKSRNLWARVVDIYKFPNSNTLKVQFNSSSLAQQCLTSGLCMFFLHISGSDMLIDEYIPILTCYRCYALEDHITARCSKDESYKVCSVCSTVGHGWRECKSQLKRCLNCDGSHNSLSMQCPQRKDIIKSKRLQKVPKSRYSDAIKSSVIQETGVLTDNSQQIIKSVSCIYLALLKSSTGVCVFSDCVNELFSNNNLPSLNLSGYDIDPSLIVNNFTHPSVTPDAQPPKAAESDCVSIVSPVRKLKFYKTKSTSIKSSVDLLSAYDSGKVVITHADGNVVDFKTATDTIKSFKSKLPIITDMKPNEFESLCASPRHFLRSRPVKN